MYFLQETEIRRIRKSREAERLARHTDGTGSVSAYRPSESGQNNENVEKVVEKVVEDSNVFEKPEKKKKKKNKKKERKDSDADTEDGIPEMDDLLIAADSVF